MKKIYPAIFHSEDNVYWVEFPDLPGCFTQGDTLEDAMAMAEEALGLFIATLEEDRISIAAPSAPSDIKAAQNSFVTLISTNVERYRRNKSVKKTLTIPQWINEAAAAKGINLSKTLQNALIEQLNLT